MAFRSMRERLRRHFADPGPEPNLASPRAAAIALILVEGEQALDAFLLIERATREGDPWSGHMALPGGHREVADASLSATAERETLEEVGLDLQQTGERLGRLSDCVPSRDGAIGVRPFVYLLPARPPLVLGPEVRQALWVPIAPLQNGERRTTYTHVWGEKRFDFPAWDVDGHIVWGLTYRVLREFFDELVRLSGPE